MLIGNLSGNDTTILCVVYGNIPVQAHFCALYWANYHIMFVIQQQAYPKKVIFQLKKHICVTIFSKCHSMAQLFLTCRKRSNHAAFGKWQKHKSELSSKSTKMRSCDTKNAKKCIFRYNAVSESQCLCGVDDDLNDNLFLYGADKLKRLYQIKRINF